LASHPVGRYFDALENFGSGVSIRANIAKKAALMFTPDRVTRFVEFSPIGRLLTFGSFFAEK
jgi:hypothetical protein